MLLDARAPAEKKNTSNGKIVIRWQLIGEADEVLLGKEIGVPAAESESFAGLMGVTELQWAGATSARGSMGYPPW